MKKWQNTCNSRKGGSLNYESSETSEDYGIGKKS